PDNERGAWINQDPDRAILVVYSDIEKMTFQTNHGGIINVDNPNRGVFRVWLMPGTHQMTYSAEGFRSIKDRIFIKSKGVGEVRVKVAQATLGELPVVIRVEPAGTDVQIDGEQVDVSGSLKLAIGEHTIEITKSGYVTVKDKLNVSNDNILFEYTLQKPKLCVVEISTTPAGAEVSIDDVKLNGVTPISDFYISGSYPIKITRDKYLPKEETILIDQAKAKNSFSYWLEPNFSLLSINTNPGAKVYLNDDLISQIKNIELSPQTVKLRAEKTKCLPKETSLIIRKGANATVDLYLDEQVGTIAISVDPPTAQIELSGDAGEYFTSTGTKIFENIPVASYELEVSLKGFKTCKRTLRLRPDETLRERITLEDYHNEITFTFRTGDLVCPKCGYVNDSVNKFCTKCDNLLLKPDETLNLKSDKPLLSHTFGGIAFGLRKAFERDYYTIRGNLQLKNQYFESHYKYSDRKSSYTHENVIILYDIFKNILFNSNGYIIPFINLGFTIGFEFNYYKFSNIEANNQEIEEDHYLMLGLNASMGIEFRITTSSTISTFIRYRQIDFVHIKSQERPQYQERIDLFLGLMGAVASHVGVGFQMTNWGDSKSTFFEDTWKGWHYPWEYSIVVYFR
ncbi:MAG: PEGA domain-containing protein, partial [Calditrichaeota bacterium]|nr:PEGA domain-containing protein [Calditrichota bacterium]